MSDLRRITEAEQANLATIIQAARNGDLALMVVRDVASGLERVALTAVWVDEDNDHVFVPFALMVDGDPYEQLAPPRGGGCR